MINKKLKKEGDSIVEEYTSKEGRIGKIKYDDNSFIVEGSVGADKVIVVPYAENLVINATKGNIFEVTLEGNVSSVTFVRPTVSSYSIILKQDATGNRTVTFGDSFLFPSGTPPTLSTDGHSIDIIGIIYDGTYYYVFNNLDFSQFIA